MLRLPGLSTQMHGESVKALESREDSDEALDKICPLTILLEIRNFSVLHPCV